MPPRFLAFDLGAESGRAMVGTLQDDRLTLEEIHRFPNEAVQVRGSLHWDLLWLYNNLLKGMREYVRRYGPQVESVGLDSWSLDFGLLDGPGALLGNPYQYRDARTEGMVELAAERLDPLRLYELTGISPNRIHTVFQLLAMRRAQSPALAAARTFLMIPDLLGYFLTGERVCERSNAIHTNLYNPRTRQWAPEVFSALDLPLEIMPPLVDPGTVVGPLSAEVCGLTGLAAAPLVAPCTHDTGSAVAGVPASGEDWAFLSSGTWSILGAMVAEPLTTPESLAARVNNEMSLSLFVCRNIGGLWLLQRSRVAWEQQGQSYSYEDLVTLARQAPPGGPVVYPDAPDFLAPPDMTVALREYCLRTGQTPPDSVGATVRCVLESLALCYRHELEQFRRLLGRDFGAVNVVGGGSRNALLCQATADATGLPVLAGPVEATVAGNVGVQALARGHLGSEQEIRDLVRRSFEPVTYEPGDPAYLDDQYEKYVGLL